MKRFATLWIAVLLCAFATAQEKEADAFVQKVVSFVKNSDEKAYLDLFPDYAQLKAMFSSFTQNVKDSRIKEEMEKEFSSLTEEKYNNELIPEQKKDFQRFISQAKAKGIELSQLNFVNSVYEIRDAEESAMLKNLSGVINLKIDQQEYEVSFSDAIWSEKDKKWFGIKLGGIRKKGGTEGEKDLPFIKQVPESPRRMDSVKTDRIQTNPPAPSKQETKSVIKSSPARKTKIKS